MAGKDASDYEGQYTKPGLRERLKEEIKASDKGGKPGQWSARKAQRLVQEYERQGGGYRDDADQKASAGSLERWTEEAWQTREGSAYADEDGEPMKRYLPKDAWDLLSDEEKRHTARKKQREGEEAGRQYVENTIEAKAARRYVSHGDASDLSLSQLRRLTKRELYDLAQDVDLDGRSKLDQEELAEALHEYYQSPVEDATKQELYDEARSLEIDGRSTMTKQELADAVSEARD